MSSPQPAGIHKLREEILNEIFTWNARMTEDSKPPLGSKLDEHKYKTNALYYARCASQVCSSWRELILYSPSLWSKIMNLNFLDQDTDNWRKVVLRRTGMASLHLRAHILLDENQEIDEAMSEFFLSILENEWGRIQKIEVVFDDLEGRILNKACNLLQRGTDVLQYLDIRIGDSSLDHPICSNMGPGDLFSNTAPALRHFFATQLTFRIDSTWISGLRSLKISNNATYHEAVKPAPFTVIEVLLAIAQIPLLEDLYLYRAFKLDPGTSSMAAPIHLPHLQHLDLTDNTRSCFTFMTSIKLPYSGFRFSLCLFNDDEGEGLYEAGTWKKMGDIVLQYMSAYFGDYDVPIIELRSAGHMFDIIQPPRRKLPGFGFYIQDITREDSEILLPRLIKGLSSYRLKHVKEFILDYQLKVPVATTELIDLISTLESVVKFKTRIHSLHTLYRELRESFPGSSCFPALQEIEIQYPDPGAQEGYTAEEAIVDFLLWRTASGLHQIETIILGDISWWKREIGDAEFLEGLKDLKVVWKEQDKDDLQEYVCGSGDPTRLSFGWIEVVPFDEEAHEEDVRSMHYPGLELI